MADYLEPLEVPSELLAWMRTQSQSAFIGDMLRVILRTGGLTENQMRLVLQKRAEQ